MRLLLVIIGGLLGVDLSAAEKHALLVGVNKYQHADMNKPQALEYAEADVLALKKVLEDSNYKVTLLQGEQATLANIRTELATLRKNGTGAKVVLVAFAGHGLQPEDSKEAYFCPYNADQAVVDRDGKKVADWDMKTMLPLSDVLVELKACGAEAKALLVDACRNDPKAGRGRGFGTGYNVGDLPENLALLLSCSKGERAWEDKAWGHGAYFHHVLKGLREGKAALDGHITANSLSAYVNRAVKTEVSTVIGGGATQRPHSIINGDVDLLISPTAAAAATPKPGEERTFEIATGVKLVFCWIPAGEAAMGSAEPPELIVIPPPDEASNPNVLEYYQSVETEDSKRRGQHKTQGFWMAKYPTTQAEWVAVLGAPKNGFHFHRDGGGGKKVVGLSTERFPAEQISWEDSQDLLKKLNQRPGAATVFGSKGKFALPHENEWEYAYWGGLGNKQLFYWGNTLDGDKANCAGKPSPDFTKILGTFLERTSVVGQYEAKAKHPWNLCDMSGNVWQWCDNWYDDNKKFRVYRGGAWNCTAVICRGARRHGAIPDTRAADVGCRVIYRPE